METKDTKILKEKLNKLIEILEISRVVQVEKIGDAHKDIYSLTMFFEGVINLSELEYHRLNIFLSLMDKSLNDLERNIGLKKNKFKTYSISKTHVYVLSYSVKEMFENIDRLLELSPDSIELVVLHLGYLKEK